MALPSLAAVSDLAAWVGQAIPDADPRAGAVLSHASTKVRSFTGQTWVDDTNTLTDVPDAVAQVVVRVASRAWLNPEGLDSVTLDDGTKRWGSLRGLVLTDEDRDDLSEFVPIGGRTQGFGVIATTRGDDPAFSTLYVPTAPEPSGEPFPWYDANDPLVG